MAITVGRFRHGRVRQGDVDASAAMGIVVRHSMEKWRYSKDNCCWTQEAVKEGGAWTQKEQFDQTLTNESVCFDSRGKSSASRQTMCGARLNARFVVHMVRSIKGRPATEEDEPLTGSVDEVE